MIYSFKVEDQHIYMYIYIYICVCVALKLLQFEHGMDIY